MGSGASVSADYGLSGSLRAEIRFGWPLAGFERCLGDACREQQERLIREWSEDYLVPLLDELSGDAAVVNGVGVDSHYEPFVKASTSDIYMADLTLAVCRRQPKRGPWRECSAP